MRTATPPPSSVRIDPLPFEEFCERAARSTIAGTGVPESYEAAPDAPRRALWGVLPALDLTRPDPPEPGGLIPTPNGAAEPEVSLPGAPPPVRLA